MANTTTGAMRCPRRATIVTVLLLAFLATRADGRALAAFCVGVCDTLLDFLDEEKKMFPPLDAHKTVRLHCVVGVLVCAHLLWASHPVPECRVCVCCTDD